MRTRHTMTAAAVHSLSLSLSRSSGMSTTAQQHVSRGSTLKSKSLTNKRSHGLQTNIVNTPFGQISLLILAGIMVHVVYLVVNYVLAHYVIRIKGADLRAVLIMSSQKTLPVSVTIISYFPASLGAKGLLVVPCIVGHVSQLFMDAFIASRMASRDELRSKAAEGAGGANGKVRHARACLGLRRVRVFACLPFSCT